MGSQSIKAWSPHRARMLAMWALLGMLALLLAACGGGDDETGDTDLPPGEEVVITPEGETVSRSGYDQRAIERRNRLREEAAAANQKDFTFFRYYSDTSEATPKACFVFSAALNEEVDYRPFVDFRPNFRAALTVEGRELCVGGLEFGDERTAILKSGLPSADGRALKDDEEVPIDFADRPPYVGFKGAGVILPRLEADGLPIETVNVDEVRVTVSRVNDRVLFDKRVSQGETARQGRGIYLYGSEDPNDVAEEIWQGRMMVDNQTNAPIVTVFPFADVVGTLEPGAYFVRVEDAKELSARNGPAAASERWIVMTDLAISAYQGGQGLDMVVRSLQTAAPEDGVTLELIARNNEILARATTDEDGYARFAAPLTDGQYTLAPKAVYAYGPSGDFAVLDLTRSPVDISSEDTGGRFVSGTADAFLYTERGIYRPGESVFLTAMIRDRAGRALSGRSGKIVVTRPNGMEFALPDNLGRFNTGTAGSVLKSIAIPRNASRGMWRATAYLDGSTTPIGSVSFSVEDFVPQRIAVELETDTETPMDRNEVREITADVRFLYGAPGAGLPVEGEARLELDPSPFDAFEGFRFGEYDRSFGQEIVELADVTADGSGEAVLRLDAGDLGQSADKPLRFNLVVSALEPGGRAVSDSVRIPYRPDDLYIGIKPEFERRAEEGARASFEVAAVGADGAGRDETLDWRIVEVDYTYDWYKDSRGEWRWRRSRYVRTVNEGRTATGEDGLAMITSERLGWGDHRLIVEGPGGRKASYQFWAGWGGQTDDGVEAPDRVRIVTPDSDPRPGQSANLTIIPPYDGEAQIVVATDRVLSVTFADVSAEGTQVRLPVTENWGEGAYVMVSVMSPRDPILQAKPRRAVGVSHVPLDMSRRTLDVTVRAPEVARPRQTQSVTVDISGGPNEDVFLTLAAVDEGILRLTKYQTPDPVGYYFGKKSLQVELFDDYGRLLDPNLGMPADVRSGGDSLGGEGLSVVPFKTVALFSGKVTVGRDGDVEIPLDLPNFNGELRLMAVAWSETAVGSGDRSMIVRDIAPVELSLPRFLAPGDSAFATASIDNVEAGQGSFSADITATDGVTVGAGNFETTLRAGQRADERIELTANNEGINEVVIAVDGPRGFDVAHDYQIQTRSAFLPVTEFETELLSGADRYVLPTDFLADYVDGSGEVVVSFSSLPVDAGALYASLSRYPYGCTEQTVSRALPLLYAKQLNDMAGGGGEDDDADRVIQEAVETVLSRQSPDGAFGLWREGDRNASPWLGAYTTDFLARAKRQGFVVPNEALDRAYGAMRNVGSGEVYRIYEYDTDVWESRWHADTQQRLMDRSAPYALYVLAREGKVDVARLRYLHDRELDTIESPLALAQLGAGLATRGDMARAKSAFDQAIERLGYDNNGDYYQTPLRDLAGVLALAAEVEMDEVVDQVAARLSDDVPDPERLSTQEKAFLLLALDALTDGDATADIRVDGLPGGSNNDRRYYLSQSDVEAGVTFTYGGDAPIWRTVMRRGAPIEAPAPASSDLAVAKSISDLQGNTADLSSLTQGDRLVVAIRISPEQNRTNAVILADLLPAGFEIEAILRPEDGVRRGNNQPDGAFAFVGEIDRPKIAEARDDRFVAAIDVRSDPVTLAYIVRAVTPGEFTLPGAVAEDMYRPLVFARSEVGRVTVRQRN